MTPADDPPPGFVPLSDPGAFVEHIGPVFIREPDDVVALRIAEHHLNRAGTGMGGLLATLVDVAFGQAIRRSAEGEPRVATVSLTTDFLRPAPAGAWLEARTKVERVGGRLAFADCSLQAGEDEVVRARAVFAVSHES